MFMEDQWDDAGFGTVCPWYVGTFVLPSWPSKSLSGLSWDGCRWAGLVDQTRWEPSSSHLWTVSSVNGIFSNRRFQPPDCCGSVRSSNAICLFSSATNLKEGNNFLWLQVTFFCWVLFVLGDHNFCIYNFSVHLSWCVLLGCYNVEPDKLKVVKRKWVILLNRMVPVLQICSTATQLVSEWHLLSSLLVIRGKPFSLLYCDAHSQQEPWDELLSSEVWLLAMHFHTDLWRPVIFFF